MNKFIAVLSRVIRYTHDMSYPTDPEDTVGKLVHADYLDEQGLHTQAARQRWYAGLMTHMQDKPYSVNQVTPNAHGYYEPNHPLQTKVPDWARRLAVCHFARQRLSNETGIHPKHLEAITAAERHALGLDSLEDARHVLKDINYADTEQGVRSRRAVASLFKDKTTNTPEDVQIGNTTARAEDPFSYQDWASGDYQTTLSSHRFDYIQHLFDYMKDNPPPEGEPQPNPHKL